MGFRHVNGNKCVYFPMVFFVAAVTCISSLNLATREAVARATSSQQAVRVVQNWFAREQAPLETAMPGQVAKVATHRDAEGEPLYYVVELLPQGFVVVSADDLIEPIIAFQASGSFDPSPENPLGALVQTDLQDRMGEITFFSGQSRLSTEGSPWNTAQEKWAMLEKGWEGISVEMGVASISDVRVAPLVATEWSQSTSCSANLYNYYTPNNYVCGCVATAMSQLMRYHSFPSTGPGTPEFSIWVNGAHEYRTLRGGDGFGGAYLWDQMSLIPGCTTTDSQRRAIGALTHDAGVSVGMNYASGGSGADTLEVADALVNTYSYSNAIKGTYGYNNIPQGNLNTMVNPNLDGSNPSILGITGPSGGHAIVVDGYGYNSSTMYHHLNMGWAGYYDAWYNLPNIDTSYTFNSVYKCVYNVFTSGTGEIISGRVVDSAGRPIAGALVRASRSGGGSYSAVTNRNGIYALMKIPSSSSYTVEVSKSGYSFTTASVSTGKSSNYSANSGNYWGMNFSGKRAGSFSSGTHIPGVNLLLQESFRRR